MSEKQTSRPAADDPHDGKDGARRDGPAGRGRSDRSDAEGGQDRANERLEEALDETFPSSDPVSVKITK